MTNVQKQSFSFAGICSIAGALTMLTGAALWGASGTDLWQALANHEMSAYLDKTQEVKSFLVANTSFWTVGVILLGVALTIMASFCISKKHLAMTALVLAKAAVPIAIVSFIMMLALTVQIAGQNATGTVELAAAVGWIGVRLDDIATIMIIGLCPLLISMAGQDEWVPQWLQIWGTMAGIVGSIAIVGFYQPALAPFSFVLIPIGMGWMIATGVFLLKKARQ
ncbi:MAG: hypothetical protein IPL46_28200 [Saprospiraceae bacterium]|nr:hypothetical protein [Saprospiraceae bacterium]